MPPKKKVVFFFAGTGRYCDEYKADHEKYLEFNDDVVRIYVSGCQDSKVGGGVRAYLWPNLDIAANNVDSAFTKKDATLSLDLDQLKKNFGNRIIVDPEDDTNTTIEVDTLALEGYSRGAVTTFAVAQKMTEKLEGIQVDIIANQPVTGESEQHNDSYKKYHNIANCPLQSVTTMYAMHDNDNGLLHSYYTTMKPSTPVNATSTHILLPQQFHKRSTIIDLDANNSEEIEKKHKLVSTPAPYHIARVLAKNGYASLKKEVIELLVGSNNEANTPEEYAIACAKAWYKQKKYYFTPLQFAQKIYGTKPNYREELFESEEYRTVQIEKANEILKSLKLDAIDSNDITNSDKAIAINSIAATMTNTELKNSMIRHILTDEDLLFTKVVKDLTSSCTHLTDRVKVRNSTSFLHNKAQDIKTNSEDYKKTVFSACFDYLQTPKDARNVSQLSKQLDTATALFLKNSLSKDRRVISWILRPVGKVILQIVSSITQPLVHSRDKPPNPTNTEHFKKTKASVLAVKSEKLLLETHNQLIDTLSSRKP